MLKWRLSWSVCMFIGLLLWLGLFLAIGGCDVPRIAVNAPVSEEVAEKVYSPDDWCDAIFKAEGGYSATWLYGIRSVAYDDEADAREICKRTVYNTLIKYRDYRCDTEWGDTDCIASRYCPVGGELDDGRCVHWMKNVDWFLNNG